MRECCAAGACALTHRSQRLGRYAAMRFESSKACAGSRHLRIRAYADGIGDRGSARQEQSAGWLLPGGNKVEPEPDMRVPALLFDLDGTLVDSLYVLAS